MKYSEFREKVAPYPFFRSNLLPHLGVDPAVLRRQVSEWIKKGLVLKLKRDVYTLNENDRQGRFSLYFLANHLYRPSYISLETALSHYGIITEQVHTITSVTSKKTQSFENAYGKFVYHHIHTPFYGDFLSETDEYGNKFFIASPERAIIDYLYFRTKGNDFFEEDIFETSFRWQNLSSVNKGRLKKIANKIAQKKLNALVDLLIQYLGKSHA